MRVVENPQESQQVPAHEVFSYDSGKPVIGDTFEAHYQQHRTNGDGTVRAEDGTVLTLGRRFFLIAGHCVAQADYQNGKVVFRCAKCGTYRVATASASPEAKYYILGWFMDDECSA